MTLKSATTDNSSRIEDLFDYVFGNDVVTVDLDNADDIGDEHDYEDTIDDDIEEEDDSLFDKM